MDMVNAVYRKVTDGATEQELNQSLAQLKRHTETHFAEEEAFMTRIGFPDVDMHVKEHNQFLTRLRSLDGRAGKDKDAAVMDLMGLLGSWWESHIRDQDAKVAAFAKSNKKKAA